MLLKTIQNFARRCGVPFHLEPNDYEGKRPDAEVSFLEGPELMDGAFTYPLARSMRKFAFRPEPLGAAEQRAREKTTKFEPLAKTEGRKFTAFTGETFGGFTKESLKFLKRIMREDVQPGGPPLEDQRAARELLRVRRELAICMQRHNAKIVSQWARIIHSSRSHAYSRPTTLRVTVDVEPTADSHDVKTAGSTNSQDTTEVLQSLLSPADSSVSPAHRPSDGSMDLIRDLCDSPVQCHDDSSQITPLSPADSGVLPAHRLSDGSVDLIRDQRVSPVQRDDNSSQITLGGTLQIARSFSGSTNLSHDNMSQTTTHFDVRLDESVA